MTEDFRPKTRIVQELPPPEYGNKRLTVQDLYKYINMYWQQQDEMYREGRRHGLFWGFAWGIVLGSLACTMALLIAVELAFSGQ